MLKLNVAKFLLGYLKPDYFVLVNVIVNKFVIFDILFWYIWHYNKGIKW